MRHPHGFGFPENTSTSHYFVDEHALCDPVIGYSSDLFVGESRVEYEFCPECLHRLEAGGRWQQSEPHRQFGRAGAW